MKKCSICKHKIKWREPYLNLEHLNPLMAGAYCHTECFVFMQAEISDKNKADIEMIKFVVGDKLNIDWSPEQTL